MFSPEPPDAPPGLPDAKATRRNELAMFWKLSLCARSTSDVEEMAELADDLGMIAKHTDWPMLADRCLTTALHLADEIRGIEKTGT